jgi:hypothetical protein
MAVDVGGIGTLLAQYLGMFSTAWVTLWRAVPESLVLFRVHFFRYLPWIVGSAVFSIPRLMAPVHAVPDQLSTSSTWLMAGLFSALIVIAFFVLADVVRVFRPEFRMTPRRLGLALVVYVASFFATQMSAIFLYIPAFYIGVKLSPWFPYSLLSDEDIGESVRRGWNDTTGVYWETLTVIAVSFVVYIVALTVASLVPGMAFDVAWAAIPALPAALFVMTLTMLYLFVTWFRWSVALAARRAELDALAAAAGQAPVSTQG